MPGTCVRSISHSLGPKRVLALRSLRVSSYNPRAGLTAQEYYFKPVSGASNALSRRQYHNRRQSSMSSASEQPEAAAASPATLGESKSEPEPALPPLSPHEFRQYNRLADHMNQFVRPRPSLNSNEPQLMHTLSTNTSAKHGPCFITRQQATVGRRACL